MKKTILQISGMSCASCAVTIEKALKKEKGVKLANINFASEKLNLEFDDKETNLEKIKKVIKEAGYDSQKPEMDHHSKTSENDIKSWKRKFFFSLFLSIPLFYLVMGEIIGLPLPEISLKFNSSIQFILTSLVIVINFKIYYHGLKKLFKARPNMDSLISIGTLAAYFYSLVVTYNIWFLGLEKDIHLYFESAAFILVFISLGKYLENLTKGRTGQAIKKLIGLQPKEAIVIRNGKEIKVLISNVEKDEIVLIKPGERIPIDGIVIDGYSGVDEKVITGESIPVEKKVGDEVIGGTINKTGVLKVKVTKVGKETMLAQIIKIVEEAMGSKAPIQLLADKISFYFVPIVIGISLITLLTWLLFGYSFVFALTAFVSVLIIACPCALGLATPTAVMMGTGLAAERGILIKSSKALETVKKVNVIVFDKTGTLTKGEPVVTEVVTLSDVNVLEIAASIEKNSEHPLAQAVVNEAIKNKLEISEVKNFEAIPGKGVKASLTGKNILLGTKRLMKENNINLEPIDNKSLELEKEGKTVMLLSVDNIVVGAIAVADVLKENSKEAIERLHKLGKKTAIITGDNDRVAQAIAKELGITYVISEVLPGEKASEIKKLQSEGNIVAMVGDGINDAPALAQADLGIALGSGTDIAIETGDIVLIKDDLRDVVTSISLSNFTLRKIKQNLFWAFFYNIIGIPIAAGILFPLTGWLLSPIIAAGAMAFSSVSVVLNSLSMKRYK